MPAKYHYSTRTNKVVLCQATKRACRYGTHFNTPGEAAKQVANTVLAPTGDVTSAKPAIIVTESKYPEPNYNAYLEYEYDYDYYGPEREYNILGEENSSYNDDPYRYNYNVYTGLHLTGINAEQNVKNILGIQPNEELPAEVKNMIVAQSWDNPDMWDIFTDNGYYSEDIVVRPPFNMPALLNQWYYSQENANDKAGVLHYVRSKGTKTEGLNPLNAIKTQLREENNGRANRSVDTARNVNVSEVPLRNIVVPAPGRLDRIEARTLTDYNNKPGIAGVLVKTGDIYRLVDGYHRFKFLKTSNRRKAKYIILS